jgi:hypothetical protein
MFPQGCANLRTLFFCLNGTFEAGKLKQENVSPQLCRAFPQGCANLRSLSLYHRDPAKKFLRSILAGCAHLHTLLDWFTSCATLRSLFFCLIGRVFLGTFTSFRRFTRLGKFAHPCSKAEQAGGLVEPPQFAFFLADSKIKGKTVSIFMLASSFLPISKARFRCLSHGLSHENTPITLRVGAVSR